MQKTIGGAKPARILITLTAVCSLVLAMLAAGMSPVKADDPSTGATTSARAQVDPKKEDLNEDLKGQIETQESSFADADIEVSFKDEDEVDGTEVNFWLFSTPTDLGTKKVEDGKATVTIPADVALGGHTLAAYDEAGEQLGWTSLTVLQEPTKQQSNATSNKTPMSGISPMASKTTSDIIITARTNAKALGTKQGGKIVLGGNSVWNDKSKTDGASYQLYYNAELTNQVPGNWSKCTVAGGTGECTITVPDTDKSINQGGNKNRIFYVKQVDAPSGTYSNPSLVLGNNSLSNHTTWAVPGETQPMTPGKYFAMPPAAADVTDDTRVSFGAVPYSIVNPDIIAKCSSGIKIAMVLDEPSWV